MNDPWCWRSMLFHSGAGVARFLGVSVRCRRRADETNGTVQNASQIARGQAQMEGLFCGPATATFGQVSQLTQCGVGDLDAGVRLA